MALAPDTGRTVGRSRSIEVVGAGGVGEVYRAHDEQRRRDVAGKVPPPAIAKIAPPNFGAGTLLSTPEKFWQQSAPTEDLP